MKLDYYALVPHPPLKAGVGFSTGNINLDGIMILTHSAKAGVGHPATQIQENGGPLISDGHIIDLDCTSAHHLVTDSKPGVHTTIQINDADAWRGDMIGLDRSLPEWNHIANVDTIHTDVFGRIDYLWIFEALGTSSGMPGPQNLIRHYDGLSAYINRSYQHKTMRWDY